MKNLKIVSLNLNGWKKKTKEIAKFITSHNAHITCLQETYYTDNQIIKYLQHKHNLHTILNTQHYSNTPTTHFKKGTAIILNQNTSIFNVPQNQIATQIVIKNRIQTLSFSIANVTFTIYNIYLPSGNCPKSTRKRFQCIQTLNLHLQNLNLKNQIIILAGDYNFVLNEIDRKGKLNPNSNDKICFKKILSNFNLCDVHRTLYPYTQIFTYSHFHPTSRIDRIYIPSNELSNITQSQHLHLTFSDHCLAPMVTIKIPFSNRTRSTHWKLNDSILTKPSLHLSIQAFLKDLLQPLTPIYDPLLWWDTIKTKIKSRLIYLSTWNQKNQQGRKEIYLNRLTESIKNKNQEEIIYFKQKLEELQQYQSKGNEIRSRIPPYTSIDNPSPLASIFESSLQKRSQLPSDTTNPFSHLNIPSYLSYFSFFKQLWNPPSLPPDPTEYLINIQNTLDNETLQLIPKSPLVTIEEIRLPIKTLNKQSAPGHDGLTANFYNSFSNLTTTLLQTFNNSFLRSELTPSQRLALIKLIPKTTNPKSVNQWRPISLLNTEYKILSSIIADRLKPLLNQIISPEQQCGLPDRQIFNNHLNIKTALDFAKNFSQPLAIIQIDFYKAFDSISHRFILETAYKLGIPSSLLRWIRILLSNLTAKINLNGYLSDAISVKCGIRQGCPLSMLLFIIGIEPLTRNIISSSQIQGLSLGKAFLKVSHYADDLTLFITHPSSFQSLYEILNQFSLYSGLKINNCKTKILSNCPHLLSSSKFTFPHT